MGPYRCARCSDCGSDIAGGPNSHRDPLPHCMRVEKVTAETDAGKVEVGTLSRCWYCTRTKADIEKRGEPMEDYDSPAAVERRRIEDEELRATLEKLRKQSP